MLVESKGNWIPHVVGEQTFNQRQPCTLIADMAQWSSLPSRRWISVPNCRQMKDPLASWPRSYNCQTMSIWHSLAFRNCIQAFHWPNWAYWVHGTYCIFILLQTLDMFEHDKRTKILILPRKFNIKFLNTLKQNATPTNLFHFQLLQIHWVSCSTSFSRCSALL